MGPRPFLVVLTALVMCAVIAGCGGRKTAAGPSVADTAKAFAEAMEAGDYKLASSAFDYVTEARQQNENWDDIASGQRDLILKKVAEAKAGELPAIKQRLGTGIKAGAAQGDAVTVAGSGGSATLQMLQRDEKWYIASLW